MKSLKKDFDQCLLDLAWSLWTELGVSGIKRNHQNVLILLEELILLTVVLAEVDPRLRDESLDWCSQYHHIISISRLKSLMKDFGNLLTKPFSHYAATLNALSKTVWPLFEDAQPLRIIPSHKSCLRPLESAALLNIRTRSLFGTGARADLVTFFLTHRKSDYAISDLVEIGYSKRNLAEILEDFSLSGFFDKFLLRNQLRYSLRKNEPLTQALGPIPQHAPSWRLILKVLLSLRDRIGHSEGLSESTKVVELRNILINLQTELQMLNLTPPPFQTHYTAYLDSFSQWLLDTTSKMALGNFR